MKNLKEFFESFAHKNRIILVCLFLVVLILSSISKKDFDSSKQQNLSDVKNEQINNKTNNLYNEISEFLINVNVNTSGMGFIFTEQLEALGANRNIKILDIFNLNAMKIVGKVDGGYLMRFSPYPDQSEGLTLFLATKFGLDEGDTFTADFWCMYIGEKSFQKGNGYNTKIKAFALINSKPTNWTHDIKNINFEVVKKLYEKYHVKTN